MNPPSHRTDRYLIYLFILLSGCTAEKEEYTRQSKDRLSNIVHAFQSYEESNGLLPPSSLVRRGELMHSWRTLIVPYVESNHFYNSYDLDSPWDSGGNSNLMVEESELTQVRMVFCGKAKGFNSKIILVLKKGAGEIPFRTNLARFAGWSAYSAEFNGKIVLLEVAKSDIHWMEPKDYNIEDILESADIKSRLRSLAIFSMKTKETEYITEANREVFERLESLASENGNTRH